LQCWSDIPFCYSEPVTWTHFLRSAYIVCSARQYDLVLLVWLSV
jgi:hypothetical protein